MIGLINVTFGKLLLYYGSKINFNLIKYDLDLLDCAYTIHGPITDSAKCTDKSIEKYSNSDHSDASYDK